MESEQILIQVIEKAKNNGFDLKKFYPLYFVDSKNNPPKPVECLIFSHDFAKAFWGEEGKSVNPSGKGMPSLMSWKYHLMTMVLEKEPLKYLEKFL